MTLSKGNQTDCTMSTLVHPGMPLNTIYSCQKSPIFWVKLQAHGSPFLYFHFHGQKSQ